MNPFPSPRISNFPKKTVNEESKMFIKWESEWVVWNTEVSCGELIVNYCGINWQFTSQHSLLRMKCKIQDHNRSHKVLHK